MSYIILIIILLLIGLICYKYFDKDILSPSIISCLMFLFCIILAYIGTFSWNVTKNISIKTIIIILIGVLSFVLGEFLSRKKFKDKENKNQESKIKEIKIIKIDNWKYIVTILGIIITSVILLLEIKRICVFYGFNSKSLPDILSFYRSKSGLFSTDLIVDGVDINFFVKQMKKVCDIACIVFMYIVANNIIAKDSFKNILKYCIPIVLSLFLTLLGNGGRSIMMHMLVGFVMMFLIIYKYKNKKFSRKTYLYLGITLVSALLLFYFIAPLLGRGSNVDFFNYISIYLGIPLPSLNYFLTHLPIHSTYFGFETFSGIYTTLNKLNIIDVLQIGSREWVRLGGLTSNVYMSFRRYFFDFGFLGVIICQFIFGFIISKMYLNVKDLKRPILFIIYGYYSYILIDQIRDEQFFGLLSTSTLAYLILILVLYYIYFKFDFQNFYYKMKKYINNIIIKIKKSDFWKKLFKNSFFAFLGDGVSSIINLIIIVILIKLIRDDGYGLLILAQSYMQIMDTLINIQSWKSVIQYGQKALVNNDKKKLYGYIKIGCILDISTAILGGVISILLASIIGNIFNWSMEMILCAQIFSLTIFSHFSGTPTAVLRIFDKFNLVAIQKIISVSIKLISLMLLLCFKNNISIINTVIIYCIADIIGNFILIIFASYVFFKNNKFKSFIGAKIPSDSKEFISYTLWGTLGDIVDIPINYFDVFIVSLLGLKLVAVYKVFKQIVSILAKVTTPIYQAIMPQFSELSAKRLIKRGYEIVIKIRNAIVIVIGFIALFVGFTSPLWLKILYGDIYSDNWYILLIYLIAQTIILSYAAIHPYYISLGKTKQSTLYVLFANIVYVLISIIFIKKFGLLSLIICNFVQGLIVIILKRRDIKKEIYKTIKNNLKVDNEIIIIGGNHHNMLGVIRALGEKGIDSNIIVTNENKYAYIVKSKYVKKYDIVLEDENEIKNILLKKYTNFEKKPILIPTSDFTALFIDKNLDELKDKFIAPNINNKQNEIKKYMDKYNQCKLVEKYNIKAPKTLKLDVSKNIDIDNKNIPIPCVLKPIISALGLKSDIEICKTREELKKAINVLREKGYTKILLQEYIKYDNEYFIEGCAHNEQIICPGLVKKERIYPLKKGTTSYGKITNINKFNEQIDNFLKLLKDIKYSGIFDIEFFEVNNDVYLNEINFRNGAPSYSFTYENIWIIYIWVLMVTNNDFSKEKNIVEKEFYYQDEIRELNQLLDKNISLQTYLTSLIKTNVFLVLNSQDVKPLLYKFYCAIVRRLKNE